MKVFCFLFCLAASTSGVRFEPKDREFFKTYLKNAQAFSGVSGRSAMGCSETKITVNEKEFTLLFNEDQCSPDSLKGICEIIFENTIFK